MQVSVVGNLGDARPLADFVPNAKASVLVKTEEVRSEKSEIDTHEIAKLERALAQHNISLKFSMDETTNSVVVQMIDGQTGEAIRQYPTEVSLSLAANFLRLQGVFLDAEK